MGAGPANPRLPTSPSHGNKKGNKVHICEHPTIHVVESTKGQFRGDAPQPGEYLDRGIPRGIPKCSKLKVKATLHFARGPPVEVEALIDTGAEVNVIHPRLVQPALFRASQRPLRLGMANSISLQGGKREVDFVLHLQGMEIDSKRPMRIGVPASAYDAEMVCDLILSYTWLAQTNALVNPRRHGILLREDDGLVWVDGIIPEKKGTKGSHGTDKSEELTLIVSPMVVMDEPRRADPKGHKSQEKKKWVMAPHHQTMDTCAISLALSLHAQQGDPIKGVPGTPESRQGRLEPKE